MPDRLLSDGMVLCRDGMIDFVGPAQQLSDGIGVVDCSDAYISPGFIDLHVHGGGNADFMDGTVDAVRTAMATHLRHGTTTIFPTTTTGTPAQILRMLDACREVSQASDLSHLAGVHLYGPFFAADKAGCHLATARRSPHTDEYQAYFDTGIVRIATCAAELPGAARFYQAAADLGCLITCGHSNANWTEMQAAFDKGMRHVDHFWCAMSSVSSLRQRFGVPMQASMSEFVLMNREMSTEVIADGKHLSNELLEFAFQMLTPQRLAW
ncbi:MAG: amidohydrolase family protein [Pirellulaceae bacterium]